MPREINREVAHIFEEMGFMYEAKDDKFRQRAYHRGAETVNNLSQDIEQIYKEGGVEKLAGLPGVGQGMAEKIEEYIKTGKIKEYAKLKKDIPVNFEQLTSVGGVGPKTVQVLYKELGVKDIDDLEVAAKKGKIRDLEGFGKKTEENILEGIGFIRESGGRMLLGDVLPYARELVSKIKNIAGVERAEESGSLRRRKETIGDVDILVVAENPKKVFDYVEKDPGVVKVWGKGETKLSVHLDRGFDIDVRIVPKESYGAALQYFTGSKAHNVKLRQIAIDKGYKLNEYGLFEEGKNEEKNLASGKEEEYIYQKLGLEWMPPELRTDTGEIEAAQNKKLPELVEYGSLKGDAQIQTNWTDGKNSIEEMAKEAKRMGLEYIVITDHTKSLEVTGGLNGEDLLRQKEEIKKINNKFNSFTIFSGSECDILKDGSLDIEDEVLSQLDVVGISVHSYFNLSQKEQTERVLKAMNNPNADILFHPTGRRINKRPPIDIDIKAVINEAEKTGTVLEVNAHPERLDLRDEYIRMAVDKGVKMCINTDAHSTEMLDYLEYGVAQARRGWASEKNIINTLPAEKFLKAAAGSGS